MKPVLIDSIDDPRVDVYRNLKKTNLTRSKDLFVVEGATLVRRLLDSRFTVDSILVTEARLEEFAPLIPDEADIFVISRSLAAELIGFKFHLGVLAAARREEPPDLAKVLLTVGNSLILFGDQIIDQQNVGMMVRIGSAFGADAVVFGPGSADPFSRRVMRVSMGNGLFMPVVQSTNVASSFETLRELGYQIFATVLDEGAETLSATSFSGRSVLVFGNESDGLSASTLAMTNRQLTIPMLNGTDSVNVSIATGIFSYSYRNQFPAE